jgi:lipopolysaccharide transport system ATP-binding protein
VSDVIISVEGLGKKYVLSHQGERGGYSRFSERLEDWVKKPFSFGKRLLRGDGRSKIGDGGTDGNPSSISHLPSTPDKEEFWALKDVSFEVKRGEVVGIIGRNGAGKSTLLKILSRITEPTEGRVTLRGRVASLLEVGTGFHPELTGRENIFLNGAILGMSKAEIRKKFDEIVAFAEVERFLDTPVKRYSSGMYVRLAFAVAAHLEPEILVVDEVLAVGDAEFQKKCLGKMKDVATGGRTVLFVSHNMGAVQSLCSHGIVLNEGKVQYQGTARQAADLYRESGFYGGTSFRKEAAGKDVPAILEVKVSQPGEGEDLKVRKPIQVKIRYQKGSSVQPVIGLHIYNQQDVRVAHTSTEISHTLDLPEKPGPIHLQASLPADCLQTGKYYCDVILAERNKRYYDKLEKVVAFHLSDPDFSFGATNVTDWQGVLSPRCIIWDRIA